MEVPWPTAPSGLLVLGEGAALGYGAALLVEGETVADVVPLSPPLRIINVPATAMSRTMPATPATHSQWRSSCSAA